VNYFTARKMGNFK